jgi:hypothetical protein
MRRRCRFNRPSAAFVVSMLALFVALGGGGAVASGVLTTKKVKKISKNQVLSLAPGLSVANAKHADNADAVGGASLGSLTVGNSSNGVGGCDLPGNSSTFTNCGSVSLTLPRSGRVLLNMVNTWRENTDPPTTTAGTCRVTVDGSAVAGSDTRYGQGIDAFDGVSHRASLAINLVTGVLGAGAHTFQMQCNDPTGVVSFADAQLSAVMIGTD